MVTCFFCDKEQQLFTLPFFSQPQEKIGFKSHEVYNTIIGKATSTFFQLMCNKKDITYFKIHLK
jgi:hypothetical protein